MPRERLAIVACALVALSACGNNNNPPSPGGSSGGGETITGRERIGWSQTAPTPGELASYRYALYVNGQRRVVEGETCAIAADGSRADCSASLPPLGAGRHTLELAAFILSGDSLIEGPRSPILQVTVQGITAPPPAHIVRGGSFASSDGLDLHAEILTRDLEHPVDLAVAADGRVFVAERGGGLRIVANEPAPSVDNLLHDLGEPARPDGAALVSLALAPDFSSSGLLYVAYSTQEARGALLRIARVRESRGLLQQPAVIASYPLPSREISSVVRFGPDAMLHLGIGTEPAGTSAQDLSAAAGKILRLRDDGTTPRDNPSGSPVLSAGHRDPRGLAWLAQDQSMWEVERDAGGDELNRIERGANYGWPLVRTRPEHPHFTPPALLIDAAEESSGLATVSSPGHPLFGNLLISTLGGRDLLRLVGSPDGRLAYSGRFLHGRFGRIAQVAAGADGSLYVITQNQDEWGPGQDVLVRLTVRRPSGE